MVHTHKSSSRLLFFGALLIGSSLVSGCFSQPEVTEDTTDLLEETEAVYFEPIGQGSRAAFNTAMEQVVYEEETWEDYKLKMETVLPFRDIDFSQLMVAFVALPVSSGGITLQIESVELDAGELIVGYLMGEPGPDCRVIDAPSVPFQAVYLRRIKDVPVRFERRTEMQRCTLR